MVWRLFLSLILTGILSASRPNIVLVITDDQGYGDLGCHGNPVVKTPHLDQLWGESMVLTDYHVAPTCSPSRASLLTGRWSNRTGVWHTVNGRSLLRKSETTLATILKQAGYTTGIFGKWHLGDNFPFRPEDHGFEEVFCHGGGGVGQTPDFWDNAYFDGHYRHNGRAVPAKGFCTDVFFENAHIWIRSQAAQKKPFFAYISTNAPHGPMHCPEKYLALYQDQPKKLKAFFGMITNIDDNVARTRALLQELGVARDTIFIFTTDNGTAAGQNLFNAGMSGRKGSPYEGGHRVPFFLHWPGGGYDHHRPLTALTHAVDVGPTLLDLCGISAEKSSFDGISWRQLSAHRERVLITDSQRVRQPIKWRKSAVMQGTWRLINGKELYDVATDPAQKTNLAAQFPERVQQLRTAYDQWWTELEPGFREEARIIVGHPAHPVVELTGHDWITEVVPPWNQSHIRKAHRPGFGYWPLEVAEAGTFEMELRRWPAEINHPIQAALPPGSNVPGAQPAFRHHPGVAVSATRAVLEIDGQKQGEAPVTADDRAVTFTVSLKAGHQQLRAFFQDDQGELGAYYVTVRRK